MEDLNDTQNKLESNKTPICQACAHCGCEPDSDFYCGHEACDNEGWGLSLAGLSSPRLPDGHCGPEGRNFEQHPNRNPDGSLKAIG